MKPFTYLLIIVFLYSATASADNLNPDNDDAIIGKTLWVNYESSTCVENFKIYKNQLTNDKYILNQPVQIQIKSLEKTPFNWKAGAWYSVTIDNGSSEGQITYNDMHASYGYIKNLYITEDNAVDLTLLKDACVSNIPPEKKLSLIDADKKLMLASDKLIDEENQRKKAIREAEAQATIEAEKTRKEKLISDRIQAHKEQQAISLKNAPEEIKIISTKQFCEYYGYMLRGEYITDFGSAADMKNIMKREASRRNLKVNANIAKEQILKLNISTCDLYASWGIPDNENKSVGSYGVHIQHIYKRSGTYVYSENGRVTSWQE
ncbi:hypothetical protein [Methylotenera sp. L2L1]|uniref:hypothetical protein n=1 Tax=Methylotenera sp. L2L1 TaxID=1502770 RepID=UPI00056AD717|nr:hypothetical protein [Methylotenera sp. L2L1]